MQSYSIPKPSKSNGWWDGPKNIYIQYSKKYWIEEVWNAPPTLIDDGQKIGISDNWIIMQLDLVKCIFMSVGIFDQSS